MFSFSINTDDFLCFILCAGCSTHFCFSFSSSVCSNRMESMPAWCLIYSGYLFVVFGRNCLSPIWEKWIEIAKNGLVFFWFRLFFLLVIMNCFNLICITVLLRLIFRLIKYSVTLSNWALFILKFTPCLVPLKSI